MSFGGNAAFLLLGAAGAVVVASHLSKSTPKTHRIAGQMRREMDAYNSQVHPDQKISDKFPDRTPLLTGAKTRKPWIQTYTEADKARHEYEDLDELVTWVFG